MYNPFNQGAPEPREHFPPIAHFFESEEKQQHHTEASLLLEDGAEDDAEDIDTSTVRLSIDTLALMNRNGTFPILSAQRQEVFEEQLDDDHFWEFTILESPRTSTPTITYPRLVSVEDERAKEDEVHMSPEPLSPSICAMLDLQFSSIKKAPAGDSEDSEDFSSEERTSSVGFGGKRRLSFSCDALDENDDLNWDLDNILVV